MVFAELAVTSQKHFDKGHMYLKLKVICMKFKNCLSQREHHYEVQCVSAVQGNGHCSHWESS
jgi:hypothetical protein